MRRRERESVDDEDVCCQRMVLLSFNNYRYGGLSRIITCVFSLSYYLVRPGTLSLSRCVTCVHSRRRSRYPRYDGSIPPL